jgi:hypothetical protein
VDQATCSNYVSAITLNTRFSVGNSFTIYEQGTYCEVSDCTFQVPSDIELAHVINWINSGGSPTGYSPYSGYSPDGTKDGNTFTDGDSDGTPDVKDPAPSDSGYGAKGSGSDPNPVTNGTGSSGGSGGTGNNPYEGYDSDGDGTDDIYDPNPNDPNVGGDGPDSDGDGTPDEFDPAPTDPNTGGSTGDGSPPPPNPNNCDFPLSYKGYSFRFGSETKRQCQSSIDLLGGGIGAIYEISKECDTNVFFGCYFTDNEENNCEPPDTYNGYDFQQTTKNISDCSNLINVHGSGDGSILKLPDNCGTTYNIACYWNISNNPDPDPNNDLNITVPGLNDDNNRTDTTNSADPEILNGIREDIQQFNKDFIEGFNNRLQVDQAYLEAWKLNRDAINTNADKNTDSMISKLNDVVGSINSMKTALVKESSGGSTDITPITDKMDQQFNYQPDNKTTAETAMSDLTSALTDFDVSVTDTMSFVTGTKDQIDQLLLDFDIAKATFDDTPTMDIPTGQCVFTFTLKKFNGGTETYNIDPCQFVSPYKSILTIFFTFWLSWSVILFAIRNLFSTSPGGAK